MCYGIAALYARLSSENKAKVNDVIHNLLTAQRAAASTEGKGVTV